jgi:hypothetical protein
MHLFVFEYKQEVNIQTTKTQLYAAIIYSSACFNPMGSSAVCDLRHTEEVYKMCKNWIITSQIVRSDIPLPIR